jgi:membrane-associated phospholipid phosphatase
MKRDDLLSLASVVQFVLVIPLARWAQRHPHSLIDIVLSRLVQRKHTSRKSSIILISNTIFCSPGFLNVYVLPISIFLWMMRKRLEACMFAATCWMSGLSEVIIREVVKRPRPEEPLVNVDGQSRGKSFPSGHVTAAVNFWGWLFIVRMMHRKEQEPVRDLLLTIPLLVIMFVGPARIYLGDHWSTDVLGGYLFGGGWLCLSLRVYLRLKEKGVLANKRG